MHKPNLSEFNRGKGLKRGKPYLVEVVWYLLKMLIFLTPFPWPNKIKIFLLRMFGAEIGERVVIKPRVNIHFPWKLEVGDNVWIGDEVFILNFEPIKLESNVCISQRAFLCGGNHNYKDEAFSYRNGPIKVREGAWIGAQCFVAPNITIDEYCVISAGSIVTQNMPSSKVCAGNPCKIIRDRW